MLNLDQTRLILQAVRKMQVYDADEGADQVLQIWVRLLSAGYDLPPPYFFLDCFAALLERNPAMNSELKMPWDAVYRDGFLWDLFSSPEGRRLKSLAKRYWDSTDVFWPFLERFMEILFSRLQGPEKVWFASSIAHEALRTADQLPEMALDWVLEDLDWWPVLDGREWVESYVQNSPVFTSEDLWELSRIQEIPDAARRYAVRACRESYHSILRKLPMIRRDYRLEDVGFEPEKPPREGHRPLGGIEGITLQGRLEGLWPSELMYAGESIEGGMDLFDVRFVEGELLYEERDNREMDDEPYPVSIFILHHHQWPGDQRLELKPFQMFGALQALMHECARLQGPNRFFFDIEVEAGEAMNEQIVAVLALHLTSWLEPNRARVRVRPSLSTQIRENPFRILIGARRRGCVSLDWDHEKLFFQDPGSEMQSFEPGVNRLAEWIWQAVRILNRIAQ